MSWHKVPIRINDADVLTTVTDADTALSRSSSCVTLTGTGINQTFRLAPGANVKTGDPITIVNASSEFVGIAKSDGTGMRRLPPSCTMTCVSLDNATPGAWFCERMPVAAEYGMEIEQHMNLPTSGPHLQNVSSGTGATFGPTGFDLADNIGSYYWNTGTTAAGVAVYRMATNAYRIGDGYAVGSGNNGIHIVNLSDASEEYYFDFGFGTLITAGAHANSVGFRYDRAGTITAAGSVNWLLVARTGGAETVVDTGVAVGTGAAGMSSFWYEVASDGSRADFWRNGTHLGTVSATIPTGTAYVSTNGRMVKTVGTNSRFIYTSHWSNIFASNTSRF
jgi:hypothetical protein